jgi:protein SCO1/2
MNFHLKEVQDRFKGFDDFKLLSITVDPSRDSVEALAKYARDLGANADSWYFVTGEKEAIYQTAQGFFLNAFEDQLAPGGFLHSQSAVLVDWEGKIRSRKDENGNILGAYDVLDVTQLKALEEDIKVLKAEYERHKHNLEK